MKFTITNVATKQTYEFDEEMFCKKLASFLTLYERDKDERNFVLEKCKLAIKCNLIFRFEQDEFSFEVLTEGRA